MAGLVNYGSSDDEDSLMEEMVSINDSNTVQSSSNSLPNESNNPKAVVSKNSEISQPENATNGNTDSPSIAPSSIASALPGPILGPTMPTDEMPILDFSQDNESIAPQSPYSTNQALIRDLTLPTIPNYDIPPSPPGSPIASTNAKFKHFLELKKQGVHFNEKLSKSAALKNPSLMQKLMDFADIDEVAEYATTLPKELWDPSGFSEAGYKEKLAKSQKDILKMREDEKAKGQRTSVDFVPATTSGESSRNGTPRIGQKSASERVMAGLEKGRSNSPHVQGLKRKTRFES